MFPFVQIVLNCYNCLLLKFTHEIDSQNVVGARFFEITIANFLVSSRLRDKYS